ncbi:MAG: hypothetical protein JRF33_07860 [Deltaproteobacteria bacterium]|nr:hypothetical protein [Deltaproteobacteria bacterium]
MRNRTLISISIIGLLMTACAGSPATKPSESPAIATPEVNTPAPTYYSGAVLTTSPDGETPLGPPVKVLAKRLLLPAENKIVEEVWLGDKHIITTLLRQEGGSIFKATDAGATFEGTLSFTGEDWEWNRWTYDIRLLDGSGKITGRGSKTQEGRLIIEKMFIDPRGLPRARIMEDHKPISQKTFGELRRAKSATSP